MGTKYSTNATSGYNATPPSDDGTVSDANKVKWSTFKTKLTDPIKTRADTIDSDLVTHFNRGPNAYTTSQTLAASHYNQFNETLGASITLTLSDAATLGAEWFTDIFNKDTANSVTLARTTASNTIDSVSSDVTIYPMETLRVFVNAAGTGFIRRRTFSLFGNGVEDPALAKNFSIAPTVASNALTVALKDKGGNDATAISPIPIAFRHATLTTGQYVIRNVTAALSAIVDAGARLGYEVSQTSFIYVYALDNAGTVELAVSTSGNFDEGDVHTTTALGTGADSGGILYSETARTSVAIRLLGRIKIQTDATTAGNWSNAPTEIALAPFERKVGEWEFISSKVASASASIDFNLPSGYDAFKVMMNRVAPATDDVWINLRLSDDAGATFEADAGDYEFYNVSDQTGGAAAAVDTDASQTELSVFGSANIGAGNNMGNAAGEFGSGEVILWDPLTSGKCEVTGFTIFREADGGMRASTVGGAATVAAVYNAVQFIAESGNIASGKFALFGMRLT